MEGLVDCICRNKRHVLRTPSKYLRAANSRARSFYANDFNPLGGNSLPALPVLPLMKRASFDDLKSIY